MRAKTQTKTQTKTPKPKLISPKPIIDQLIAGQCPLDPG
jgi:hypothetical protein